MRCDRPDWWQVLGRNSTSTFHKRISLFSHNTATKARTATKSLYCQRQKQVRSFVQCHSSRLRTHLAAVIERGRGLLGCAGHSSNNWHRSYMLERQLEAARAARSSGNWSSHGAAGLRPDSVVL